MTAAIGSLTARRRRSRIALLAALASLACAAPAAAFSPPALYVRLAHANSIDHTPVSDWMALGAQPSLSWLGGYEIGYALQDAPGANHLQHAALRVTGVPDGQPTQPLNTPYCSGQIGDVGTIVPVGVEIQFEGAGPYAVSVSVGPSTGGPNDCMASGPDTATSSGSFGVDASVSPAVVGSPLIFRARPLSGAPFVGVRTPAPAGGDAETRCARDATVNADASVTGPLLAPAAGDHATPQVAEQDFVRPGSWTCVARGVAEGIDDGLDSVVFGGPWSQPLRFDVRSDFRRSLGTLSKRHSKQPALRFTAEFPEAAGGGTGTLSLRRLTRCKGTRPVYKTVGTFKGVFDAGGHETVKVRRPRPGVYIGVLSFSGTRFYTRSVDPNPALLGVSDRHTMSYIPPTAFPQCPNFP